MRPAFAAVQITPKPCVAFIVQVRTICMLALRSSPVLLLPRLLLAPQRLLNTIGRKPRAQSWLTAGLTAADSSREQAAAGLFHSSSTGKTGSSSNNNSRSSTAVRTASANASGDAATATDLVSCRQAELNRLPCFNYAGIIMAHSSTTNLKRSCLDNLYLCVVAIQTSHKM